MTAQRSFKIIVTFALAILPFFAFSQEEGSKIDEAAKKFNASEMIMHHIKDSYGWHFFGSGDNSFTLSLPVILFTDNGLVTFMSSAFHHDYKGKYVVEKDGMKFVNYNEKVYQLEPGATALQKNEKGEVLNASRPWDFSITKNVAAMMLTIIVMLIFFFSLAGHHRKSKAAPKGFNNLMESLVLFVRNEIARPQIGDAKYKKFMPFLLTVFFFIWITNLLGLLPGAANVTGNIAITISLGLFTLVVIVANGNMDFWKHTVWMPGIPTFVKPILAVIEILGVFVIKPIALIIRLFANITAGHIIILSILSLIFILESAGVAGISVPFALFMIILKLLVAFLQAFIFTMLSALFIGMAVAEHEHEHH